MCHPESRELGFDRHKKYEKWKQTALEGISHGNIPEQHWPQSTGRRRNRETTLSIPFYDRPYNTKKDT